MKKLYRWAPGLESLVNYRPEWFAKDFTAALSVAVIALPIGLALSSLVGLGPEVGVYATILPMTVYSLFSKSRQLIIGPDAPTCMMVAAVLLPFASSGKDTYYDVCVTLTVIVGILSIGAGLFRLGFISDFLSKPILIGYMNGLTLTITMGQIDKIVGFPIVSSDFFSMALRFLSNFSEANVASTILGVSCILFLLVSNRLLPKIPSSFLATVLGSTVVILFGLQSRGVATLDAFPVGLPQLGIRAVHPALIAQLIPGALSIVLISYCSQMLTAKSFALKLNGKVDANQEFIALGAANISSGLSGGFVASGADGLTAVAHSAGGKTALTSIMASAALVAALLFLTDAMAHIPYAVLGAIVIVSVLGLMDIPYLRKLYRIRKQEFLISIVTSLCVLTIGVMYGVVLGMGIAIVNLIQRASKPEAELLGRIEDSDIYANMSEYPKAKAVDRIAIYKFNSALVFFNAEYFQEKVRDLLLSPRHKPAWILIDASAMNYLDATGNDVLEMLADELKKSDVRLAFACVQRGVLEILERSGLKEKIGREYFFVSVRVAVDALIHHPKTMVTAPN